MNPIADPSPAPPGPPHPAASLCNVPNILSAARFPLAIILFVCIAFEAWLAGLVAFTLAAVTDWIDGWWARKYGPLTLVGRNLDPIADKFLVCGAFVYLIPVPGAGIDPWMVTVVVGRELIVTGLRGIVEATGQKFGADWFGKLKMVLQCAVIIGVLLILWWRAAGFDSAGLLVLEPVQAVLVWSMLAATVGSGFQYLGKAAKLLR